MRYRPYYYTNKLLITKNIIIMSEKEEILKELKDAFPLFEIEMLSTEQRGNKSLIVVKGFSQNGNIDDWYSRTVYPIWWEMISI